MIDTLALVSDTHGNVLALEAVLADLEKRRVDLVVNLGDHASGPLWPRETCRLLSSLNWISVMGNHDRQLLETPLAEMGPSDAYALNQLTNQDLAWLSEAKPLVGIGRSLVGFHGTPTKDTDYLMETIEVGELVLADTDLIASRLDGITANFVVCGHSHQSHTVQLGSGTIVINPGSVGLPAYSNSGSIPHRSQRGKTTASYAILSLSTGQVDFIDVPYDNHKASEKALRADRHDWAQALRSGLISPAGTGK